MIKIKGLLCNVKGNQQSSSIMLPFNKQIQGFQKGIKKINQSYFRSFIEPYFYLSNQMSQLNKQTINQLKTNNNKTDFYYSMLELLTDMEKCYRNTNGQIKDYCQQGFKVIENECQNLKIKLNEMYQKLKQHQIKQFQLTQDVKKYTKNHKNILQAIDLYKNSFQDVKLIYNMEQKIKRYKNCQTYYYNILEDLKQIQNKIQTISNNRQLLKAILQHFKQISIDFARVVWLEIIKIPYNIMKCFINGNKQILKAFENSLKLIAQKDIKNIFQKFRLPFPYPQKFDCKLQQDQNQIYPHFLPNLKHLKKENFAISKKLLIQYYQATRQDAKQRQYLIQKIKNYFINLSNSLERMFITEPKEVRQMLSQKTVKPILESLASNINNEAEMKQVTFSNEKSHPIEKVFNSIVQLLEEQKNLFKNMSKLYSQHVKQLVQQFDQQSKLLVFFISQFKNKFYSLFAGKKEFKKDLQSIKSGSFQGLSLTEDQITQMRDQIIKKSQFILVLVIGFNQKFKINNSKIKNLIINFFQDFKKHIHYEKQLYEKQKNSLNQEMTELFQNQANLTKEQRKNKSWIVDNQFYKFIVKQKTKVKFQSQVQKAQSFKKLKKPIPQFQQKQTEQNNLKSSPQNSPRQSTQLQNSQKQPQSVIEAPTSVSSVSNVPSKRLQKKQSLFKNMFGKNYEQFMDKNVKMIEGQKYVGNFPCGLADNIIISGRLYLSTERLFFHSRFNASNVFFGQTKIQIPKTDIKKIQKRYNAIIFDNSISITTVNGEIFFTSFVARDKAYDLICQTFQIDQDNNVFVSQQSIEEVPQNTEEFNIHFQQDDDLPDSQIQIRQKMIDQLIENYEKQDQKGYSIQYKDVFDYQVSFPGINAAKFFKIFDSGQQFMYKNKTFGSFWHYFKGQIHKNEDLEISSWQPNILEYLNPNNVKSQTPHKFYRRIEARVPIPASSIPFMPKFLQSVQNTNLYFYSKDKYTTITHCVNSKAPYTDCFYLKFKRIVEKVNENKIMIKTKCKMVFTKSPLVRKMIESRTFEQATQNAKSQGQQIQKYLQYLQRTMIKKNKVEEQSQKVNQNSKQSKQSKQNGDILYLQKIEQLEKQNKNYSSQLQIVNKQNSTMKIVLLCSIIINIILMVFLFIGNNQIKDSQT